MKIKHIPIYFILLTLLVCTGCWEDTVTYYGATFSDDDSSIVFMRDSHERRTSGQSMLIGSYPTRNNRYQLMIEDVDGSNRRAVGPETSQATDMSGVYFMKSAGYLLKRYGWAYESNKVVKFDLDLEPPHSNEGKY